MTDFATIGVRSDTTGLRRGERDLARFREEGARTEQRMNRASQSMASGMRMLRRVIVPLAATMAATFGSRAIVSSQEEFLTRMARIESIIEATGGAAGRTAQDVERFAQSLARQTLESVDGVLEAQQVLLTFRNVQGDVFDDTIRAAADLSAAMGQDLVSSTRQLARAMEDPVTGMQALTRSGTVFTQEQRDMVREMVEAGRTMEAQRFILDELESQYGGASQAGSRMAQAQDSLSQSMRNFRIALAESISAGDRMARVYEGLDRFVQGLTENIDQLGDRLRELGVVMVALAGTQIPAAVAAIANLTRGLTLATAATRTFTAALGAARAAIAILGGPVGVFLGLLSGAAAAALLMRDNTTETDSAIQDLKESQEALNAALGIFHGAAAPEAGAAAIDAARDYRQLAAAARDVAASELAKAEAMAAAAGRGGMAGPGARGQAQADADLAEAQRNLKRAEAALDRANREADRAARSVTGAMSERMSDTVARLNALDINVSGLPESLGELGDAAGGAGAGVDTMSEAMMRAQDWLDRIKTPAEHFAEELRDLNELHEMGYLNVEEHARAVDLLREEFENASESATQYAQQFENAFGQAFTSFVTGAQSAREAAAQLLNSLSRLLANRAFTGLFGGLFGGGASLASGFSGGQVPGMYASGTLSAASGLAWVGERGPELVNFRGGEQVFDAQTSQRMAQGGGGRKLDVTVTMDESTGRLGAFVRDEAGRVVARARPQIVSESVGAAVETNREKRVFE